MGGWQSGPRRNVLTLQSQAMTLLHYKMETEGQRRFIKQLDTSTIPVVISVGCSLVPLIDLRTSYILAPTTQDPRAD